MTTAAGAEALQESTLPDELVESTTIEELESTVRTESDGVVAEEKIRFHDEVVENLGESENEPLGHPMHDKINRDKKAEDAPEGFQGEEFKPNPEPFQRRGVET